MELGLLALLSILLLVFIFVGACIVALRPINSEELVRLYLSVGLRELSAQIRQQIHEVEKRQRLLRKQLAHLDALTILVHPQTDNSEGESSHLANAEKSSHPFSIRRL